MKPWQLFNHLYILRRHYPALEDRHFALMLSSHSAQDFHLKALDEIEKIGGIDDSALQNTPLFPINPAQRFAFRNQKLAPCSRWGSCSGKHAGFVMALNADGKDSSKYLEPSSEHFIRMKKMLGYLLQVDWNEIPQTTDGCRLPNYAFAGPEIARLYNQLARPFNDLGLPEPPHELKDLIAEFDLLKRFMSKHPEYVGGEERFDTELMQGKYSDPNETMLLAKEGADGLLTIAVAPCPKYPSGLGIVIKSSSGDDPRYFTLIALELLDRLGILLPKQRRENKLKHLNFSYHFNLPEPVGR
ncbi:MAG: asparaginase [Candidatus Obscuribacterales bacterium]|nr:asparaginase [Candidatus Obscuribacterales bacterium]